mmetsp:Transcript_68232/g.181605  ORF Transcript_68232/g.181605 Transcript_68232/m.181605 type:complete len:204 (+) Transcript_68232:179-790(+)
MDKVVEAVTSNGFVQEEFLHGFVEDSVRVVGLRQAQRRKRTAGLERLNRVRNVLRHSGIVRRKHIKRGHCRWLGRERRHTFATSRIKGTFFVTRVRGGDGYRRHGVKIWFLVGARSRLKAGSLDLGADHLLAQKHLVTQEQLMIVAAGIVAAGQTAETVEIQLALEGCKLGLTKVFGHNVIDKLFGFVNDKASSVGLPRDHVR